MYAGKAFKEWDFPWADCDRFQNVLSFELFRKCVFSPSIVSGLHNASLKLLTIHAHALQVINSVDELKIYLKAICDGLESVEVLYLVLSDEQREAFANLYIRSPFKFPYSKIEQLMSHTSVLVYDWKADKVIEDERLSDRTGIAILHLCNCLFFDENTDFTWSLNYCVMLAVVVDLSGQRE